MSGNFQLGIDRLLNDPNLQALLKGRRTAMLATPASMTSTFRHSIDALADEKAITLSAAFGPQHGIRGDKQDNMVETRNSFDEALGIPVFSLYGKVRRLDATMLDSFDVLLYDIQDVGCRIYTYITTLFYLLEDCAKAGKTLWVLDRPNPSGRSIEGLSLLPGHESFVGAAPMPMRHGLTMGEAAQWYCDFKQLDIDLKVISMEVAHSHTLKEGCAWPEGQLPWVNPSPNLATINSTHTFPGTVMLEGTTLSEGRGTTRALEVFGAPDIDIKAILSTMHSLNPVWMQGGRIREAWFEPTFHKHSGQLCQGLQLHTDFAGYQPEQFKPFRLITLFLKAVRLNYPDYALWREFDYEYEYDRLAIDVINGGPLLREWVDDSTRECAELEQQLMQDEQAWLEQTQAYWRY